MKYFTQILELTESLRTVLGVFWSLSKEGSQV